MIIITTQSHLYINIFTYVCIVIYYQNMEDNNLEKAAYILRTIAHPVRLAIIDELRNHNQVAVSDICRSLKMEQSVISHHLINMKLKGLLKSTKMGQQVLYSLKEQNLVQVIQCVSNCNCNM